MSNGLLAGTAIAEQIKLERLSREMGKRKYLEKYGKDVRDGQGGVRPEVRDIVDDWHPKLSEAMRVLQERTDYHGYQYAAPVLNALPAERLAAAVLGEMLSTLMHEPMGVTQTKMIFAVARAVTAEIMIDWGKETMRPDGLQSHFFDLCKRYKRFKPRHVVNFMRKRAENEAMFDKRVQCATGAALLSVVYDVCTFRDKEGELRIAFQTFKEPTPRGHKAWVVRLHYGIQEHLYETAQNRAWLSPQYLPCVAEPKRFTKEDPFGGYHSIRYKWVANCKPHQWDNIYIAAKGGQCDELFDCMNAHQSVGFKAFPKVIGMVRDLWDSGGRPELGVPRRDKIDELPRLPDELAVDKERLKEWKLAKSRIKGENIKRASMVASFRETVAVAEMFANEERLYFPPSLDFRGRSSPKCAYFSYIHDDVREAMLLLARPKPPGDEGYYWLMVHAAGLYGQDKLTYDERAQWTRDHMHQIARAVKLGLEDDWWQKADKGKSPWQFFAACNALVDAQIAAHYPIAIDGTCNGLQHLAAMTRDEKVGRLVNLIPGERPQDQYADVTPATVASIAGDTELSDVTDKAGRISPAEIRRRALAHMETAARDIVKQPVMTLAYNVTQDGMASQIGAKLKKAGEDPKYAKPIGRYIAAHLLPILKATMQKPMEAMEWMADVAGSISGRRLPNGRLKGTKTAMSWVTELGLPVEQEYRRQRKDMVNTAMGTIRIEYDSPDSLVDLTKQIRGFAPNLVHSRDAEHKWRTARRMVNAGCDFFDKHDSYRTHACDRARLAVTLREEFVQMYETDYLAKLKGQLERRFGKELPELPAYGTLDIRQVLDSEYFFK